MGNGVISSKSGKTPSLATTIKGAIAVSCSVEECLILRGDEDIAFFGKSRLNFKDKKVYQIFKNMSLIKNIGKINSVHCGSYDFFIIRGILLKFSFFKIHLFN